jgi:hypothetical protein
MEKAALAQIERLTKEQKDNADVQMDLFAIQMKIEELEVLLDS